MIPVDFTHSTYEGHVWPEIRVDPSWTVGKLKDRIYIMCGTTPEFQVLTGKDKITGNSAVLDNEDKALEWYGICHEADIHIQDTNPYAKETALNFHDVSRVDKYIMSDDEYDKRKGTVREFFRKQREQKAIERAAFIAAHPELAEPSVDEIKVSHPIGHRCEVNPGGRRGVVRWVGKMKGAPEGEEDLVYIGVELDEPTGRNDGTVKGVKYFETGPSKGCFQRPKLVNIGDYPELDPFADLDEF